MSVGTQPVARAESPYAFAFGISGAVCILVFVGLLHVFGVPVTVFALLIAAAALLMLAFRYPVPALGATLAFMPIYPIAFLVAKFLGPSYISFFEGSDRVVLLVLAFILWRRYGVKLVAPDWFLLVPALGLRSCV